MTPKWYQFQEDICTYFNSIGASAQTNITVKGVRTSHDIDILIKTKYLGEDLTWIIEAKKWKSKVPKEKVLALRTIVDDIGADRGFIISEKGFQKGAKEACVNTNIRVKTFDELKTLTRESVESEILKEYKKRLNILEARYWAHNKSIRQDYGLRGHLWSFPPNFSGSQLLQTAYLAIALAERKKYPIDLTVYHKEKRGDLTAENFQQLINWLNLNLNHLDTKILEAEIQMIQNGDFKPCLSLNKGFDGKTVLELQANSYLEVMLRED